MSRFLAAVTPAAVGGLREMFETDMGRNGVGVMQGIGMFDRGGSLSGDRCRRDGECSPTAIGGEGSAQLPARATAE